MGDMSFCWDVSRLVMGVRAKHSVEGFRLIREIARRMLRPYGAG
jgi:hypothetical protein